MAVPSKVVFSGSPPDAFSLGLDPNLYLSESLKDRLEYDTKRAALSRGPLHFTAD